MNQENCIRCAHQPAELCGECRPCHYVSLVLVVIHNHWPHTRRFENDKETELETLRDRLRDNNLKDFIANAKENGATLSMKLGNTILRLSHPAKITPDELKRKVCEAISKYIGEINGIREYESKPGNAGRYMKFFIETVASWISKAGRKAA